MPTPVLAIADIRPGDYYEDCFYHPCLCMRVLPDERDNAEVDGISLIDGTYPHTCTVHHCGIRRLTFAEAMRWRFYGPDDVQIPREHRWWSDPPDTMFWSPAD